LILNIRLEAFCEKSRRASGRCAVVGSEPHRRTFEQKNAACPPLGLARHPQPVLVAPNEKQRDGFAENAGVGAPRKFSHRARRSGQLITRLLIARYDEANAAQKRARDIGVWERFDHLSLLRRLCDATP
jgi:hypothetical protein